MPMFDGAGDLVSVRARNVAGGEPKAAPPLGWTAKGMVMANPLGQMALALGTWPWWAERKVMICEGEPDWLSWAARPVGRSMAVLGLGGSGGWSSSIARGIPAGSRVLVRTHEDPAGDHYAEQIAAELEGLCYVSESEPIGREARRAEREAQAAAKRAEQARARAQRTAPGVAAR